MASTSSYLADRTLKIGSKVIPWDGYQRAGLLSADDVALIQRVAGQKDKAQAILEAEGEVYASLYIRLLSLSRYDTLQNVLYLIGEMLTDHDERIPLFLAQPDTPYPALLKLLESQDDFVRLKSAVITSTFLSTDPKAPEAAITKVLFHLTSLLRNSTDPEGQDVGVQCLEGVLRVERVRKIVWAAEEKHSDEPKLVEGLVQLLKSSPSSQMQYQLAFCFWLLTFDTYIAKTINARYNMVVLMIDLARTAVKEKVIRMVVAAFRNLIVNAPAENLPSMLVAKLLPFVQSLATRMFSDEETKEDVDFLVEQLKESFDGLSTYDEYTSELQSGLLSWSPPHMSDEFWIENAAKLAEKGNAQLKVLIELLNNSKDPLVLAVAANDVGQFVKYNDSGKKAVEDLGAKTRVMELMGHPDADVKYRSLVATQIIYRFGIA